jgi:hypothetical protein
MLHEQRCDGGGGPDNLLRFIPRKKLKFSPLLIDKLTIDNRSTCTHHHPTSIPAYLPKVPDLGGAPNRKVPNVPRYLGTRSTEYSRRNVPR